MELNRALNWSIVFYILMTRPERTVKIYYSAVEKVKIHLFGKRVKRLAKETDSFTTLFSLNRRLNRKSFCLLIAESPNMY